jgi:hypothetical protein
VSSADVLRPGVRLGDRYQLRQRLGAGGMGEVWLAVDEVLKRSVAVKAMLPGVADDPDFGRRFAAEATAMARINHPAVASIHDYGHSLGVAYLVMEYVDGESLAQLLARDGRMSPDRTMRLIAQAAEGLQAVHDQGLVHRDIKPANLLVRRDGSVVITDFGIARHEDASRLTASGAVLGTPTYLSPEQVRGEPAGPRSDIYSLGLVAYECLAGARPFVGENPYAVALQRLQSAPRTIGIALPGPVLAVVERALAITPEGRWPSASALAAAARAATLPPPSAAGLPSGPAGSASAVAVSPIKRSPLRRPVVLAALAAVAAVLVTVGVIAWVGQGDGRKAGRTGEAGRTSDGRETGPTGGAGQTAAADPAGFLACGVAYCPAEPMCWHGLVVDAGKPGSPRPLPCTDPHYWETFLAVPLPAGEIILTGELLIAQADFAKTCSAEALAERSRTPRKTSTWKREAWPVTFGGGTMLHCIVASPQGETTGTVINPAR